jgi:hypothetical protein
MAKTIKDIVERLETVGFEDNIKKVKVNEGLKAIEMLGKYHKMFQEDSKSPSVIFPDEIKIRIIDTDGPPNTEKT